MSGSRANIVSILNNDNNPSFAVRSNSNKTSGNSLDSSHSEQQHLPPVSDLQYSRPFASSESPTASPRGLRHPFDPVSEAVQPTSPNSSEGSAYEYLLSQPSSVGYHPYARQDLRRDPYQYSSRGPAPPRTPPEIHSSTPSEKQSSSQSGGNTRGTGRKNKYPCPYAASHGCSATFTTSGHAARHGKKHTGEKSVHCPICNKAFTRKDNMKQHIRTHRTHSDDMRSTTSEPDSETRWALTRPDSGYATTSHHRTISQTTDASMPPPSGGSRPPP
ncbi:hypothetical protein N7456_002125 [Penicillium angulare]|uniref:C2H2-type domain-containing protein n=1 Tax=Penicillium angulare TaxID=116970 RepID=A0A9W9G7I6_9EURO|nr:hypothetical protein N7456_002125 [Penicillium angulare]